MNESSSPITDTDTLATDFALMRQVAMHTDARAADIRVLLSTCISRLSSVPPSVWGGLAATRFQDVVVRWNSESLRLCTALDRIAETIRLNEAALLAAGQQHARRLGAAGAELPGH